MGGVNAVVVGAALIPGAIWLLTRQRGPRRAALIRWWALAVVVATSWWAVPLAFQARYGIDFLPFTERAGTTTAFTPPFEVLRGVADWLSYARLQGVPLMAGYVETTAGLVIAGGALVVAVGLYGLAQRRLPEARFLVITFLVGTALVGAGYGGDLGNPFASTVVRLLDGPLGLFRNVYKFAPVVLLPVAGGLAAGVDALASAVGRRRGSLAKLVPVGVGVLVLLGAWPLLGGDLLHQRGFTALPTWWEDARAYVQDAPGRTLILPGLPQSSSTWGFTAEEPLEWDNAEPFAVRQIAPLGSSGATRVLDTVEATIASGGSTQLPAYLARNGFSTVLVRNDGDWRSSGAPSPAQVTAAARASGLVLVASFGPDILLGDEPGVPDSTVHPIDVYEVPGAASLPQVTTTPVSASAVVSGDAGTPLQFGGTSLEGRSVVLASDLEDGDPLPPRWLVTEEDVGPERGHQDETAATP
jgi:arabinofuranan 3-O-arabinosyltransferase